MRGREIRLLRGGTGQPLLYLHDPWTYRWLPIHDRLAERYDVVLPIHPGFIGSGGLEEMDRMEDLVFHYLDLLEVLGLEQPILMGASLGGWIAIEFAIRHAGLLRALVLIDALGLHVPGVSTTDIFQLDPAQMRAALFGDATAPLARELVPDTPPQESLEAMFKARQVLARFAWQFPENPKLARYLTWSEVAPTHPSDIHPRDVATLTSSGCMSMLALPYYADDRDDDLGRSLSAAGWVDRCLSRCVSLSCVRVSYTSVTAQKSVAKEAVNASA